MTREQLMNARFRQFQNQALYNTMNRASGLPTLDMPEPHMTAEKDPTAKGSKIWLLVGGVAALYLFGKAFYKGGKKR